MTLSAGTAPSFAMREPDMRHIEVMVPAGQRAWYLAVGGAGLPTGRTELAVPRVR
jgi:hypothetical protein